MKRISIQVNGRVQGVWFRASTQQKALELGLCGTVRNQPDGSVFIDVEGNEAQLKALQDWCWKGPQFAKVERVLVKEEIEIKGYSGFDVVR